MQNRQKAEEGTKRQPEETERQQKKAEFVRLCDEYCFVFTHFVSITYDPTREELLALALRGAAVVCKRGHEGIDLILVALPRYKLHQKVNVNDILLVVVQCKDRARASFRDVALHERMDVAVCLPNYGSNGPFISIFLEVGTAAASHLSAGSRGKPLFLMLVGLTLQ